MKFTIDTAALRDALAMLSQVIERKDTIPILRTVRLEADAERGVVKLTGTDLDNYLTCEVAGEIVSAGAVLVLARRFEEIAKALPAGDVSFGVSEGDELLIAQGDLRYCLPTVSIDTFPEIPAFGATPITAQSDHLRALIEHTKFSITHEEGRYTLSGAKVIIGDKGTAFITTDGHRLSLARINDMTSATPVDVLVPLRALKLILAIGARNETVQIGFNEARMFLSANGCQLDARLLYGTFPDYEKVIPKTFTRTVEADADVMASAVGRVSILADERSRAMQIRFNGGTAILSAKDDGEGNAEFSMPVSGEGESMTVGFSGRYLQEALSRASGTTLICLNGPEAQVGIFPQGDLGLDEYVHVLMPMRL